MKYSETTKTKIRNYYKNLYQKGLGLKDWEERVRNRLSEEKNEVVRLKRLQFILNKNFIPSEKCFIVGAGTGGGPE